MAKHHLLCVHGVGQHANDWVTTEEQDDGLTLKDGFEACWKQYSVLGNTDDLVFHSIHYDDAIVRILNNWENMLGQFSMLAPRTPLMKSGADFFNELHEKALTTKGEDSRKQFLRTHVMDLLFFYTIPSVTDAVITYVGRQCLDIINQELDQNGDATFSVLGHSLGTSVVEKTLKAMFNEGIEQQHGSIDTLKGDFKFQSVSLIANASFTLARADDEESFYINSNFKPGGDSGAICQTLLNLNHKFDPVGQFRPFHPPTQWLHPDDGHCYVPVELSRLSSTQIHSINHYLRDPRAHIPFFNSIKGYTAIDKEAFNNAKQQFDAQTPLAQFKSMTTALEKLRVNEASTMKEFVQSITAVLEIARNYKREIHGLLGDLS
ncbi:hypothetical protein [Marinobacter alexandrii]|uniref:hypothetical protein n=1 Tax=Marinobacter alexandrii TaxID=2570351 RepID=UPI0011092BC9|nr:hypothetical protein [Marinobacter alexandrii]